MFFIIGVTNGNKELKYEGNELNICKNCGAYTRYIVYMTYMCLSLFFIPTIKWGKKYYVKTTCCAGLYELNSEKGKMIERGENVKINDSDLVPLRENGRNRICRNCGYATDEDFLYCPKCGEKF